MRACVPVKPTRARRGCTHWFRVATSCISKYTTQSCRACILSFLARTKIQSSFFFQQGKLFFLLFWHAILNNSANLASFSGKNFFWAYETETWQPHPQPTPPTQTHNPKPSSASCLFLYFPLPPSLPPSLPPPPTLPPLPPSHQTVANFPGEQQKDPLSTSFYVFIRKRSKKGVEEPSPVPIGKGVGDGGAQQSEKRKGCEEGPWLAPPAFFPRLQTQPTTHS